MIADRLELRTLGVEDEASFRAAVSAFGRHTPEFTFAFGWDDSRSFADYISVLDRHSRGIDVPADFVPNTFFVGVVDHVIVGRLSLRHSLNESLARVGGHIGYGVILSQRGRGYATAMLQQVLPICAARGIDPALLTCDIDNVGSRKVIESCGGVFESVVECADSGIPKRRYWLKTTPSVDQRSVLVL